MRSRVSDEVSGVSVQVDQSSRARSSEAASCSPARSASGSQLSIHRPQALQASALITSDNSSALSFLLASASKKNGFVTATGNAPSTDPMLSIPSWIACLRSSGNGIFSLSQEKESSSIWPKVGVTFSAFLLFAIIRDASFDDTWRTASAPVSLIPASISAAGAEATTPIALSGH